MNGFEIFSMVFNMQLKFAIDVPLFFCILECIDGKLAVFPLVWGIFGFNLRLFSLTVGAIYLKKKRMALEPSSFTRIILNVD